jgi:hypothetical protein
VLETGKIELELSWLEQPRLCSVWEHRTVWWCTGQCPVCQAGSSELAALGNSPVRQRLSGCQWPAAPFKERNRAPDSVRCAPDCPVRHVTEGKDCLPRLLSTAPSCLGAIKGTPRRMEEYTKHSLSNLDHSHSILAHSFDILVI